MRDLLSIGTNRRESMIGTGIGLGLSGYRFQYSWDPSRVSGLKGWWDASDISTVYQSTGGSLAVADGDPVGEWKDKSGNGLHFVQASGTNKPSLKLSVKGSKNIVRFDGVNDNMTISGSASSFKFLHSSNNTIFAVLKASTLGSKCIIASNGGTAAKVGMYLYVDDVNGGISHVMTNGTNLVSSNIVNNLIDNANFSILTVIGKPSDATASNRSEIRKNGGSANKNNSQTNALSTANSFHDLMIGSVNIGADYLSADFCEVLIYDSAVSSNDRLLVESYLNSKWGIY